MYWTLQEIDRDGKVVKTIKKRGDSFVYVFFQYLCVHMKNTSDTTVKNTAGVNQQYTNSYAWDANAASADTTRGIIVGTSGTAVAYDQYAAQAAIAHGTGAGQLSYGGTVHTGPTAGPTSTHEMRRTFTNTSGGSITIQEVCLYIRNTSVNHTFMFARDVVNFTITNGNSAQVTMTLQITS
jgi:hypothetical protein